MRLEDAISMINSSTASDWNSIPCWGGGAGPSYKNMFVSWQDPDGNMSLGVDSFSNVAVYREDVSLSLAWGLDRDNRWWEESHLGLHFSFQENFPDSKITVFFGDVFWNGSLIARRYLLSVDGGRGVLPMSQIESRGPIGDGNHVEYFLESDLPFARLVHELQGIDDFQQYLEMSGLEVRDRK